MKTPTKLIIAAAVMAACTGCDQATKSIAQQSLASAPPVSLLNDFVRFEYLLNPGATLGLGADLPQEVRLVLLVIIVGLLLAATVYVALKANTLSLLQVVGVALVVAGGMGNVIDRLLNNGVVIDFVSFGFGSLRTGVMNVADVAVFGGMALILWQWTKDNRALKAQH